MRKEDNELTPIKESLSEFLRLDKADMPVMLTDQ